MMAAIRPTCAVIDQKVRGTNGLCKCDLTGAYDGLSATSREPRNTRSHRGFRLPLNGLRA